MQHAVMYAELHCCSNFTFLEGASSPEQMAARAAALGYRGIAITDRDGLYAAVRLQTAANEHGIRPVFASEVTLENGETLVLLARNVEGYRNLSLLLTAGRLASPKGQSSVSIERLSSHARGLIALSGTLRGGIPRAIIAGNITKAQKLAGQWLDIFGARNVYLEVTDHLLPVEAVLKEGLVALARATDIPLVATQDARYAEPGGRRLQDILTCIRHHTTIQEAGTRLLPNGEYFLHPPEVQEKRFRAVPGALRNTCAILERCELTLSQLDFTLPTFSIPPQFSTELEYLEHLTFVNAPIRFPEVDARVVGQLRHELEVIGRHRLAGYFLIVWDIMRFCHKQGILAQGRGSAANSAVCFSLGITNVDPVRHGLLFERFLSEGRKDPPDIDIDIAADRREEVIQYVYARYGRDHVGMVCEVISYRARSAVRDIGKALGLSLEQVDRIAKGLEGRRFSAGVVADAGLAPPQEQQIGGEPQVGDPPQAGDEATGAKTLAQHLWELCLEVEGFPRHLGIHVGGMILCGEPLGSLVPIENATMAERTVVQWDKDDIGALKMAKIDLLGLGMLGLVGEALTLIEAHEGIVVDPARLTYDDPTVYDLLCRADTVGVFQVESRAQMNILPRLKPRCFYDLVVEVALIRPGPIQGEMVHPYLRRRAGEEPVMYPHPDLEPILARTLGVPLFQEQGMRVAITAAGFTAAEADALRRAMSSKRSRNRMEALKGRLEEGMRARGYDEEIVQRIVAQIEAFSGYGFPESHAASFALIVYVSAHLKRYFPLAFYAALLNNQPMGFYAPDTIVRDAIRHRIQVLPVDVLKSDWKWTIEDGALRAGLGSVRGLGESSRLRWEKARAAGPWRSVEDLCARTGWPLLYLERLAAVGALSSLGVDRREALWRVQGYRPGPGLAAPMSEETIPPLKPMGRAEALVTDLSIVHHSVSDHPIGLMRPMLDRWKVFRAGALPQTHAGQLIRVAGVVSVRQRPPTAKGFCFLTLEDESGMMNIIVRPDKYDEYRRLVRRAVILLIEGRLQRQNGVINVMAEKIAQLDEHWARKLRS